MSLPHNEFAVHSFRIGAATAGANVQAGVEDLVICTVGQWNSSAFLLYIWTPPADLAQFTKMLVAKSTLTHTEMTAICLL